MPKPMQLKRVAKRLICLTLNPSPWNLSESFRPPSSIPNIFPHSHSYFGSYFNEKIETIRKCSQAPNTTFNHLSVLAPHILCFSSCYCIPMALNWLAELLASGQGCCKISYNAQNSSPHKNYLDKNATDVKVRKPYSSPKLEQCTPSSSF